MNDPPRTLTTWVSDLSIRAAFFRNWFAKGEDPKCFLIPSFWKPQGFFSAVLQQASHKANVSIDEFEFCHDVLSSVEEPSDVQERPKDGVLVFGIWMESARWDVVKNELIEAPPHEPLTQMPVLHFLPELHYHVDLDHTYRAPFYRTLARAGVTMGVPGPLRVLHLCTSSIGNNVYCVGNWRLHLWAEFSRNWCGDFPSSMR